MRFVHASLAAALLLGACATAPVVTPEGAEVASMRAIIDAAPDGVPVRILVLHGQGAWEGWNDPDQARPPVAQAIAARLMSGERSAEPLREPGRIDLGLPAPVFEIGSRTLEPSEAQWREDGQACRASGEGGAVGTAEPYLDTVRFTYDGHPVTVFELSYWPILGLLKCDQLIERDTALIGRDTESYRACAARFPQAVAGRPRPEGAPRPAAINKAVKERLFEGGFGDAVLTAGPVGAVVHDAVLAAIRCAEAEGNPDRVAFVVTESLGSYVLIEALLGAVAEAARTREPGFVARADSLYMLANQWALLALADIGVREPEGGSSSGSPSSSGASTLQAAMAARDRVPVRAAGEIRQIVAFNDPSDLLTYQTPDYFEEALGVLEGRGRRVTVRNVTVPVATRWFGLFANPVAAHLNYRTDERVLDMMIGEPAAR